MDLPAVIVRHDSVRSLTSFAQFLFGYLDGANRTIEYQDGTGVVPSFPERCRADGADLFDCGQRAWHRGEFDAAVGYFERVLERDGASEERLFWLAVAHMRQGEASNCFDRIMATSGHSGMTHDHTGMCSLPLEVLHNDKTATRKSAQLFTRLLDDYGPNPLYRWLLNFAAMPGGDFPAGVPERYRLGVDDIFYDTFYGARRREAETRFAGLRFRDVAAEVQVDWSRSAGAPDAGRGIAVEDFNRDGCLDIVTISGYGPAAYYENRCDVPGQLGFVDKSMESGLSAIRAGHIVSAADYDNDGWIDLLVGRHYGSERGDFVLLRNLGRAKFRDVTQAVGLIPPRDHRYHQTWSSAWGDIDNDGDLDLFVAGWHFYNANLKTSPLHPLTSLDDNARSALFRNDGGHFVDVTDDYGVAGSTDGHNIVGSAFGDYDGDGLVDLAVTRLFAPGLVLLHNEGGRFEPDLKLNSTAFGFMTSFVDVDHDGKLELFVAGAGSAAAITEQVVFQTNKDSYQTGPRLWRRSPSGEWARDAEYFGDDFPLSAMGVNFGDLNHDGALDWYLGTGNPEGWYVLPNQMLLGRPDRAGMGERGTDNISMLSGFGTIQKGHGIVFADFDRDGDQDIYSSLGGYWPGDIWPNQLFLNESVSENRWIKLRLRGCRANRDGLGSTIAVHTRHRGGVPRTRYFHMDNQTGFGSAPYLANIGLGDAESIERIEVRWIGPEANRVTYQAPMNSLSVLTEVGGVFASRADADESCPP